MVSVISNRFNVKVTEDSSPLLTELIMVPELIQCNDTVIKVSLVKYKRNFNEIPLLKFSFIDT